METKKRRKRPKRILSTNVVDSEKQAVVVEQVDASAQTQGMEGDIADICMIADEVERKMKLIYCQEH